MIENLTTTRPEHSADNHADAPLESTYVGRHRQVANGVENTPLATEAKDMNATVANLVDAVEQKVVPQSVEQAETMVEGLHRLDETIRTHKQTGSEKLGSVADELADMLHQTALRGLDNWRLDETARADWAKVAGTSHVKDLSPVMRSFMGDLSPDSENESDKAKLARLVAQAHGRLSLDSALAQKYGEDDSRPHADIPEVTVADEGDVAEEAITEPIIEAANLADLPKPELITPEAITDTTPQGLRARLQRLMAGAADILPGAAAHMATLTARVSEKYSDKETRKRHVRIAAGVAGALALVSYVVLASKGASPAMAGTGGNRLSENTDLLNALSGRSGHGLTTNHDLITALGGHGSGKKTAPNQQVINALTGHLPSSKHSGSQSAQNNGLIEALGGSTAKTTHAHEHLLTLSNHESIWSDSKDWLGNNGYSTSARNVDLLKDAILHAQGLNEEKARHLAVGYQFGIPQGVLSQLEKAQH